MLPPDRPKHSLRFVVILLLGFLLVAAVPAGLAAQDDEERRRAFQLYNDGKFAEALPVFEKLAAARPNDSAVIEAYGLLVLSQTAYLKDAAARTQARVKGRQLLLRAQQLGADSALLKTMLEKIPPDGRDDAGFSTKKDVDDAMREGEAAFAAGNYPKAVEMYQRALLLDPKLYEAALFTGDVYFKTEDQQKAGEWFARASAIDPERETAYRYWGDALMKQGRVTEAGDKFAEAYIAEPYNRLARAAFVNWGNKVQIALTHPRVDFPADVTKKSENADAQKNGSDEAWLTYGVVRANWKTSEFLKQHPNEKTYRHSLREEAAAIRAALKKLDEQKSTSTNKIDPSLQVLRKLEQEGLLEAFILLAMPDEGIAKDFVAYRRTNLENLRRYVKQYVRAGG